MSTNIMSTTNHIKLDERNHVEKPLLTKFDRWGITPLLQDLLTGKMRVTPLLNDKEVASL
ncbi:MAG: hypothetical protein JRE23_12325 [Deltaproteobacteria bacterium]|nr:hypothetical protein [Deltaproteobacteria bacterium]